MLHARLSAGRVRSGVWGSDDRAGHCGAFFVQGPCGAQLRIISSDGTTATDITQGWEHVSVSLANRCPNWTEMSFVKDLFWEPEETVVQLHVPASMHINCHPYCLHLWRDTRRGHALPPAILVGP